MAAEYGCWCYNVGIHTLWAHQPTQFVRTQGARTQLYDPMSSGKCMMVERQGNIYGLN